MHLISLRRVWVVAPGALVVALAAAAIASAHCYKAYSVVLTSSVASNGSTVTAKFVNEDSHQSLGSADLTAPAGYTVSSASVSQGSASVSGNVVELRDSNLAPGASLTATIAVSSTTCAASTWSVVAKQTPEFQGGPGVTFTLDTAHSNLDTAACGMPCKKGATCTTNAGNANGSAQVSLSKSTTKGQLFESVNSSQVQPLTCEKANGSVYVSADPNTYDLYATSNGRKLVKITITNPVVSRPLGRQQICFDAPYKFQTKHGTRLRRDGNGGFIGLLPDCGRESNEWVRPCSDHDDDKMIGSTVLLVVNIPSGLPGDPHMS